MSSFRKMMLVPVDRVSAGAKNASSTNDGVVQVAAPAPLPPETVCDLQAILENVSHSPDVKIRLLNEALTRRSVQSRQTLGAQTEPALSTENVRREEIGTQTEMSEVKPIDFPAQSPVDQELTTASEDLLDDTVIGTTPSNKRAKMEFTPSPAAESEPHSKRRRRQKPRNTPPALAQDGEHGDSSPISSKRLRTDPLVRHCKKWQLRTTTKHELFDDDDSPVTGSNIYRLIDDFTNPYRNRSAKLPGNDVFLTFLTKTAFPVDQILNKTRRPPIHSMSTRFNVNRW